jgi:hypothetical protein
MSLVGNILGVRMSLLIGPSPVALPMPIEALQAIEELEIQLSDTGPSGFRLVLAAGRTGPLDFLETPFVADPRFSVGARLVVTVICDITPTVIFDGIVSKRLVTPGDGPRQGKVTLLGRDLSVEMDKEVKQAEHPAMDETAIATIIAASYAQFGMIPMVMPPKVIDPPIPIDRTPQQRCTDWAYLKHMAKRHGYETYVDPGPVPLTNTLYWGPNPRPGIQQPAMTINSGPASDAYDVSITHDAEELTIVQGQVLDRTTGSTMPVLALVPSTEPLGLLPDGISRMGQTRIVPLDASGLNFAQAMARAQAIVDDSARNAVRVTGTVNTAQYNRVLKARDRVDLRGAGMTFNGTYKVSEVRHRLKPGGYEQGFVLTRGELGPKLPVVIPQ